MSYGGMFNSMFMNRYSNNYRADSSSDEEETSAPFRINAAAVTHRGGAAAASSSSSSVAPILSSALDDADAPSDGVIQLETEDDGMDVDAAVAESIKHLCVECQDQPASRTCADCRDNYCDVCYVALHKRGSRATHSHSPYVGGATGRVFNDAVNAVSIAGGKDAVENKRRESNAGMTDDADTNNDDVIDDEVSDDMLESAYQSKHAASSSSSSSSSSSAAAAVIAPASSAASRLSDDDEPDSDDESDRRSMGSRASSISTSSSAAAAPSSSSSSSTSTTVALSGRGIHTSLISGGGASHDAEWFVQRARYIPLRLTMEERKFLRLLEATLNVSEYTDKVDIVSNKDKMTRIKEQLRDICSILSGLVLANDYKRGQTLVADRDFAQNSQFFRNVFELGRRHKIRNPEKMRNSFGKLIFVIQDSVMQSIEDAMEFNLNQPLRTAFTQLDEAGALDCLRDPRMAIATGDIATEGRQRPEIERDIKQKEQALKYLAAKYQNKKIDEEGIRACVLSICDNHSFLISNRHCCDTMLTWLTTLYSADNGVAPWSLAILGGRNGARLTHSHSNQYSYVLQSLTLWREILHDAFALWVKSEEDLFDNQNPYRLRNTGQGLNRVQQAPRVGRHTHNILAHCQRKLGSWVGSSVIHLGDHNVPNAFMFVDKYNQVSRILNPIVLTIKSLPRLCEKADIKYYIDKIFGGADKLRMLILTDFFRHAFDGSGADNFFDAGSCIDGRLTSAWNWCNKVDKKSYYAIFQLAGFSSFDGQWSD